MNKVKVNPVIIIWCASIAYTVALFFPLITHPNSSLLAGGGDGIKNYFNYLYYIKYDHSFHFTGMNYPYGEHIVFTDNMPLLAYPLMVIHQYFPGIENYAVGIMHIFLLASLPWAAYLVYKIIRYFNVAAWWAIISSLFIVFMSPQIFKLQGHFGMGFIAVIPLLFYFLMRYHHERKLKFVISICITVFFSGFLHVYFLAFGLMMCVFYSLSFIICNIHLRIKYIFKNVFPIILAVCISIILFYTFLSLTDPVRDRTNYPYGAFGGITTLSDVFTSQIFPLGYTFKFLFGMNPFAVSEGGSYIGIVAIFMIVLTAYRGVIWIIQKFKKKKALTLLPAKKYHIFLLMSLFFLLFGMGAPITWGFTKLIDYISLLRQFRTMGRFSWFFYYPFMIFIAIYIYTLFRYLKMHIHKKKWISTSLMSLFIIVFAVQLSGAFIEFYSKIFPNIKDTYVDFFGKEKNASDFLSSKGYDPKQFQCMLVLPFFHIGSEKIWIQDNGEGYAAPKGAKIAIQTGIPMCDVMLSRTSWQQTFDGVQLIDGYFSDKPTLQHFDSREVLVTVLKQGWMKPQEREWINEGKYIGTWDETDFYAVNLTRLKQRELQIRDSITQIAINMPKQEGLIGSGTDSFLLTRHYDNKKAEMSFAGEGAFVPPYGLKKEYELKMENISLPDSSKRDTIYIFSAWIKVSDNDYRSPYFIFRQYDATGTQIELQDVSVKYSTRVENYWFFINKELKINPKSKILNISVVNSDNTLNHNFIDEVAIYPANKIYFYKSPNGVLFIDNRPQYPKK